MNKATHIKVTESMKRDMVDIIQRCDDISYISIINPRVRMSAGDQPPAEAAAPELLEVAKMARNTLEMFYKSGILSELAPGLPDCIRQCYNAIAKATGE